MSKHKNYKSEHRFTDEAPKRGLKAKEEDDEGMAVKIGIPASNQRPVSVLGWTLALAAGAAIWLALFIWLA